MKVRRTLTTALRALRRNPLRAMLTTLGIVIGVAAVIAMMEIGSGSAKSIQKSVASMGANNIMVRPGTAASGGISFGAGTVTTLAPQDCDAILRECPAVRSAAPVVQARTQVVYGHHNWVPFFIFGSTPAYLDVRNWTAMSEGDMFTDRDVRNANRVCVLGHTLVRELFEGQSPLGKEVRIQNVSFRVVGVLSRKGANMMGMDQDDIVLAPWTTVKYRVAGKSLTNTNQSQSSSSTTSTSQLYPGGRVSLYPPASTNSSLQVRFTNVDEIVACARSTQNIPAAMDQIARLLRERHRIRPDQADDFNLHDMAEMTRMLSSTTAMMTNLLLCVALISLLVGGVGIMNIMLVSVTERTREIGLRMAVGARASDILRQFLVEAIFLCLVGGAIGIVLGHGGSFLVMSLLRWPIAASPTAIAAAVIVSASVGILFGFYPAWKASRLDPIEALRYE